MRKICIFNHKGGVGKTTTAINLAAGLSRKDKKVLLVDFDPQGNINTSLKVKIENDLYDAIINKMPLSRCIVNVAQNFDVLPSKENLVKIEHYLSQQRNSRTFLKDLMADLDGYDYLILDCPPSLGILNQNALAFGDEVFIPVSTDFLGYDALGKVPEIVRDINAHYDHDIKISRIIPTFYDRRNKICKLMLEKMMSQFNGLVSPPIRYTAKLKEAPMHGKSIFSYAKSSPGADDYWKLVEDIVQMEGKRNN